jgi:Tol biopolymer transport system component
MKRRYRLIFLVSTLFLAGVCVFSNHLNNQHRESPLLLYITTLPDLSHSIAILDPLTSTCSETTYVDVTLKGVESARWSPSRDQIEYVISSSQYVTNSLWVIKPDGSNHERVISSIPIGFGTELIRLSPDQRYVAFLRSDERNDPAHWEIDIIDIKTGTPRQLMNGVWTFEWSPTSNLIAVSRWSLDDSALYIVQPDGVILGKYKDAILSHPAWSPDGRQIAFSPSYSLEQRYLSVEEIYAIDIRNGQKVKLTHGVDQYKRRQVGSLSWSPDGEWIAFISHHVDQDRISENNVLFIVNVYSGREVRLAGDVEWSLPVWSPDSKRIAFVSTMDGSNYGQIYLADITLGTITQLTCDDRIKKSLSW